MGKKTVLFLRSSPAYHCWPLFKQLRLSHPDSDTRWICVLQPSVEREFREMSQGVETEIWMYTEQVFTYAGLKTIFGDKVRQRNIDMAYVPLNHPKGKGYFQIMRFLTWAGVDDIVVHTQDDRFERVALSRFVLHRVMDRGRHAAIEIVDTIVLVSVVPLITLYYVCLFAGQAIRRKLAGRRQPADRRPSSNSFRSIPM